MADADRVNPAKGAGPVSPGAVFAPEASAGLIPVARDVEAVKGQAESGALRMSEEAARTLLASITGIRAKVHQMITGEVEWDGSLRFGSSFVATAVSKRLEGAASGTTAAAIPVLKQFDEVLEDLELTVRAAAGMYIEADEDAMDKLKKASHRLGIETEWNEVDR